MRDEDKKALSELRLENAKTLLKTAKVLISVEDYKSAANRSYYAIFNAMRAELALFGVDFKRHSAVISDFRVKFLKTEVLDKSLSDIIAEAFEVRTQCDYDDHYIISKEEVERQVENAEIFVATIEKHLGTNQ